jgi:putative ABC transport system substrate-binding protein
VSLYIAELAPKRLQFLLEIVPRAKRIGVISNPDNPTGVAETKEVNSHATSLGLTVEILSVRGAGDLEKSFSLSSGNIEAVFVTNDPFIVDLRDQLVKIAASRRVPTIYFSRDFVEAGGLMSYGSSIGDGYRKVAQYVSQVLLGARPADLPVQQPTKFELIVNLKTAKLLGLELSPTLLARADEVIE